MKAKQKPSRASSTSRQKSAAVVRTRTAERVRRAEQRIIPFLTQDELRQLFKVISSKRDKAIFLVAYRHGLRASEIGLLQRADVDVKQGRISIHRIGRMANLQACLGLRWGQDTARSASFNKELKLTPGRPAWEARA